MHCDGGRIVVCRYGNGVWQSTDVGDHWTQMASGLTGNNLMVLCCTIAPDSDMFIGTLDEAVFRANLSSTVRSDSGHSKCINYFFIRAVSIRSNAAFRSSFRPIGGAIAL